MDENLFEISFESECLVGESDFLIGSFVTDQRLFFDASADDHVESLRFAAIVGCRPTVLDKRLQIALISTWTSIKTRSFS